jgi:plasmid stabilization system protein ParE
VTLPVVVRAVARREFDAAVDWYAKRRDGLGERFVTAVRAALQSAADSPGSYPKSVADLRSIRVAGFPYRVHFRATGNRVVIVAIFHTRRDQSALVHR